MKSVNTESLFDLEIKKDVQKRDGELEAQSLGPAIRASVKQCKKTGRLVTIGCGEENK
ncbi:type A lantibiotic [Staphylococcus shinii]|uniref:type A lantibiotic n=1 Tax=Staphylococcus shinii TaxID=2912228 RepID=UPI003CE8ED4E